MTIINYLSRREDMDFIGLPNSSMVNFSGLSAPCVPSSIDRSCIAVIYSITVFQLVGIASGVILNMIIVTKFFNKPAIWKKIPLVLLFNQALADLFNVGV